MHSSGKTFFSFHHIEGITLGAGEEIVIGGANDMGVDRIGGLGDRSSERQTAGVYGISSTAGSLTRIEARGESSGTGVG